MCNLGLSVHLTVCQALKKVAVNKGSELPNPLALFIPISYLFLLREGFKNKKSREFSVSPFILTLP